jgi:hypothetical protein
VIDLLLILLGPMLQCNDALLRFPTASLKDKFKLGLKITALFIPALLGIVADIVMNNTTIPILLGGGWFQEWTFSTRLERMCVVEADAFFSKQLCIEIAKAINRKCPTHDHIKAVL